MVTLTDNARRELELFFAARPVRPVRIYEGYG